MSTRVCCLALVLAAAARPLAAQPHVTADAEAARVHFRSMTPLGEERSSGVVAGARARVSLGLVSLEASYAQGRLSADTGIAPSRDLVDGSLLVAVRPTPWLALRAGPQLRAYVAPGGTERWVLWEGRVRVEAPILADVLAADVEGWLALSSGVNADPGASGAAGGQGGLTFHVAHTPLWLRLSYAVDQEKMKNGVRTESLEAVALTVGLGGR